MTWTCPMHPEIVRDRAGSCPKCGMALEAVTPVATGAGESDELEDMTRRLRVALVLAVLTVGVAMSHMLPGDPLASLLSMRARVIAELALATPVCLWAAWPFYVRAAASVRNRSLNMFTLIGLGVAVAYVYSVVAALAPNLFPDSFREGGVVAVYFEAAAVITTLVLLGQVLELRARRKTGAASK